MGLFPLSLHPRAGDQSQQNDEKGTLLRFRMKTCPRTKSTYLGTSIQETAAEFLEGLEGDVLKRHFVPGIRA